jgi:CopG family transcriptional regulator, nickel-responsive regulator
MSTEPTTLARLSMSLPADLFRQLDLMVEERGLPSRSQLIAELIRHALAEHEALTRPEAMLAGTITLVYRGDWGRVRHQLAQTQAEYLKEVISSQHVFLEDDQSLEVLLVQGPAVRLKELCDALRGIRGVHQLQLVTTTALLPPLHEQDGMASNDTGTRGKAHPSKTAAA